MWNKHDSITDNNNKKLLQRFNRYSVSKGRPTLRVLYGVWDEKLVNMRWSKLFISFWRSHDQSYKLAEECCCCVLPLKVNSVKCLQDTKQEQQIKRSFAQSISHALIHNNVILVGETPICKILWRRKDDQNVLQDRPQDFTEDESLNLTPSLHLYLPSSYQLQEQKEDTAPSQENR